VAPGGRDGVLGGGEILDGDPERPEQSQLAIVAAPWSLADQNLAELGPDVVAVDRSLLERQAVFPGLGRERLAAVAKKRARDDGLDVELARGRGAGRCLTAGPSPSRSGAAARCAPSAA